MTNKPIAEALDELLRERDWSARELARRTREESDWGTNVYISRILQGRFTPSPAGIEAIAKALRISPTWFPEYRLDRARDALDWRVHGLARALRVLEESGLSAPQRRSRRPLGPRTRQRQNG